MDLNSLLNFYEPPLHPAIYWFNHVYHLYELGLPINNPYPDGYICRTYIRKAMEFLLTLIEQDGKASKEAFTSSYAVAISEIEGAYS